DNYYNLLNINNKFDYKILFYEYNLNKIEKLILNLGVIYDNDKINKLTPNIISNEIIDKNNILIKWNLNNNNIEEKEIEYIISYKKENEINWNEIKINKLINENQYKI